MAAIVASYKLHTIVNVKMITGDLRLKIEFAPNVNRA